VNRAIAVAFFLSSALGGAAGVLFRAGLQLHLPDVGRSVELKGLAVIILGGMGSVPGAVVAGFLLGLIEVFTVANLGSSFRDAVSFACCSWCWSPGRAGSSDRPPPARLERCPTSSSPTSR